MLDFSFARLLPVALGLILLSFVLFYLWALLPRSGTAEWIHMSERPAFRFVGRYRLGLPDFLIALLLVVLWGAFSLWNLGSLESPQTFHRFEEEYVVIDLGAPTDIGEVRYFSGLNTGHYALYFSQDGSDWTRQGEMNQGFNDVFKWNRAEILDGRNMQFLRLRAETPGLYMGELAIYDVFGYRLNSAHFSLNWSMVARSSDSLFDEQTLIPDHVTFYHQFYFDEIYHARTAYEHVRLMDPYEISHPPLGKLIISMGIHLFGMTPFGWRFMGALSGALMIGIFFLLTKNMFGKRLVALCGTAMFAFNFMLFTQTRIATIDTYAALFILLMFWFMYRYISQDYDVPFYKTLPALFLTGLFFGLGGAAKWSSLFIAPALVLFWIMHQALKGRHYNRTRQRGKFAPYLLKTILVSIAFFVLIPGIIYYLSYLPYTLAANVGIFSRQGFDIIWQNQEFMFGYHADIVATHPFSSTWWQWVLNVRPILYYLNHFPTGTRAVIAAFGNPLIYWGGLLAIFAMPYAFIRRGDGRAFVIFAAYLLLLAPWFFITRLTFAYHYFPNTIFLALALAYVFDHLIRRGRGWYKTVILSFTILALALFVLFFPVLSGRPASFWLFENVLRWFPSWPL